MWWTLLVACSNPISNQVFYEDSLMVAALPSTERVGPPTDVRLARVGNSALLEHAVEQAAVLGDVTEVLARSGDAVRAADPDTRSDVGREWRAVQAAGDIDGGRVSWWVRTEVLQPDADSVLSWTMELSDSQNGPFTLVGEGAHSPDGEGSFIWDLGLTLPVIGLNPDDAPGVLEVIYDTDAEDVRSTEVLYRDGTQTIGPWLSVGNSVLAWQGTFRLLDDSDGEPVDTFGTAQVFASEDGGWGVGQLYPGADAVDFDTCWNADGDREYEGGGVDPVNSASGCSLPNPF